MHNWNNISFSLKNTPEGFNQLDPIPDPKMVEDYYKNSYFQNSHSVYREEYRETELKQMFNENTLRAQMLFENEIADPHRVLDVGCGEGWYLDFWYQKGADVMGLDFTDFGVRQHNPHLANAVLIGDLEVSLKSKQLSSKRFDLIYLGNVLEHVPKPMEILAICKALLSQNGVIQIRVPNDFSDLQNRLLEEKLVTSKYWVAIPDHINYFNLRSLTTACHSQDLKILDAIASFPVDWFLANNHSNYVENKTFGAEANQARLLIENLIIEENQPGDVYAFYRALANINQGRNLTVLCCASR